MSYLFDRYINPSIEVERLVNFITNFLIALDAKYKISAILTCSFYYRQDMPYQFSCVDTGVPFYVLWKEYLKDDCTLEATIEGIKIE